MANVPRTNVLQPPRVQLLPKHAGKDTMRPGTATNRCGQDLHLPSSGHAGPTTPPSVHAPRSDHLRNIPWPPTPMSTQTRPAKPGPRCPTATLAYRALRTSHPHQRRIQTRTRALLSPHTLTASRGTTTWLRGPKPPQKQRKAPAPCLPQHVVAGSTATEVRSQLKNGTLHDGQPETNESKNG